MHRDLKPQNILVTKLNEIKIMDYGVSRVLSDMDQQGTRGVGTKKYMAPGVHQYQEFNHSCDVSPRHITELLCRHCPQSALPMYLKI